MSVLSIEQKHVIVEAIVARVHRPNLNTFFGRLAVNAVVNQVDNILSNSLTPELSQLLSSTDHGITPQEAQHIKEVLPGYLLSQVHNPFLSSVLAQIIDIVVDVLVTALQTGNKL